VYQFENLSHKAHEDHKGKTLCALCLSGKPGHYRKLQEEKPVENGTGYIKRIDAKLQARYGADQ
jgi:hypothetical protein